MKMGNLNDTAVEELLELPETGMGFQLVEASIWGTVTPLLVLNGQRAIDLSQAGLVEGDDAAIVLRNGLHIIEAMKGDVALTMIAAPGPLSFKLLHGRLGPPTGPGITTGTSVAAALPSSLIKHDTLKANRVFYRYSAFSPDKRVDPKTGNFLPGTDAAPASEVPFVPTGSSPWAGSRCPIRCLHHIRYEIEAFTGTPVDFGTVAPAFGRLAEASKRTSPNPSPMQRSRLQRWLRCRMNRIILSGCSHAPACQAGAWSLSQLRSTYECGPEGLPPRSRAALWPPARPARR